MRTLDPTDHCTNLNEDRPKLSANDSSFSKYNKRLKSVYVCGSYRQIKTGVSRFGPPGKYTDETLSLAAALGLNPCNLMADRRPVIYTKTRPL